VLNEAEPDTASSPADVDPVKDLTVRRCRVCDAPLARRNRHTHAGRCARVWKTYLQRVRRRRRRGC
jgi:hypothetical protein